MCTFASVLKQIIYTVFTFFILTYNVAQVNDNCSSATVICANQPQFSSNSAATVDACSGCSDGASAAGNFCFDLNNTVWFSFITNDIGGDVNVVISNLNCDNSVGFSQALDAVIIDAPTPCDESSYTAASNCVSAENNALNLSATGLTPNTTYYVLVDGDLSGAATDAASCGFDIEVSGSGVEIDIEAGDGGTIFIGESFSLEGDGPTNAIWSPESTLSSNNTPSTIATPDATTTYFYSSQTANGCVYQDGVTVVVETELYVTNTITPNDDGFNDFWEIGSIETRYPASKITVFDRWGQVVFKVIGYTKEKRWNGTFKGKKLPSGVYYYVIDLNTASKKDVFTGYVTIIR